MLKDIYKIAVPYFAKEAKIKAFSMLMLVLIFELIFIYLGVQLNTWNINFYNALQEVSLPAFKTSIKDWTILVSIIIIVFIIKTFLNLWIQLEWRYWLTKYCLDRWTKHRTFYGLKVLGNETDNPDQRISDDVYSFVSNVMGLGVGLLSATVSIVTYIRILKDTSGSTIINFFGHSIVIESYMVWIAIFYSLVSTLVMHYIGQPLVKLLFEQEKLQANFRYGMMRIREYSEAIAFYDAAGFEKHSLLEKFRFIIINSKLRIRMSLYLSTFLNFYSNIANIVPILIVSPRYFAQEIKLGDVMQISGAFGRLNDALSWIIDSYTAIASLRATTIRLATFLESIEEWESYDANKRMKIQHSQDILLENLIIFLPSGQKLLQIKGQLELTEKHYIICGPSGAGKSTLLRTLAGLWPWAEGKIAISENIAFVPQHSYMPDGTLLQAIQYPMVNIYDLEVIGELLEKANLGHLHDKLHVVDEWNRILSGGEKQRICLLRAILQKPDLLIMDEAFSALDSKNVARMYQLMKEYLPNTVILAVSHGHDETTIYWKKIVVENGVVIVV